MKLGADHAINYKTADFVEEAKTLTGGKGVDVILDMVAGSYVAREIECLAEDGRLVIIAVQGGIKSEIQCGPGAAQAAHDHRLDAASAAGRVQGRDRQGAAREGLAAARERRDQAGDPQHLRRSGEPSGAAQAHALMESNQHIGKIVLTW